jgi:branched-chain amino acid transport system permease protein
LDGFLNLVVPGLTAGAIYALLAMGYNVIFATTGVLNFAHGEMFMVGTMIGVFFYASLDWPLIPALIATLAVAAIFGVLEERFAIRPATRKGHGAMGWVLSSLGVAIVLRSGFALVMGPDFRGFPDVFSGKPMDLGGVLVSQRQISLVVLALLVALILDRFYRKTMLGRALGAVAQDTEAASLRGLPVANLSAMSFAIGSALAALTGFFAAPIVGAFPTVGFAFALKGFVAAAVGGIPEIRGAIVGGLLLGLIESFGADLFGAGYRDAVVFATLLIILGLRPAGLFGRESVRAV